MASTSKITIALLFFFALAAATPAAARAPGFNKAAGESHEAPPPAEPLLPQLSASNSDDTPAPPPPTECMTPLLDVMPCMDYLTNPTDLMTPTSTCCDSFKELITDAPVCICHVLNGDLNKYLADPVDPVRMVLLPLTCGALPPLQSIIACASESQIHLLQPTPLFFFFMFSC
jgi:hypothetical protein